MRRTVSKSMENLVFSILFCLAASLPAAAQEIEIRAGGADAETADIAITANVTAKELKFEIVPETDVVFSGTHERQTVWESDRENLPERVRPGVIYRDIGIRLRIYSRFADIERIVDEALGNIPPKQDPPAAEKAEDREKNETEGNGERPAPR